MINPSLLSDSLAAQVASEVLCFKLRTAVNDYLANEIVSNISKELLDIPLTYIAEMKRKLFFEKLFKSLESHERKIGLMIKGIWEEQRKIIISNLKKMKKEWLNKDNIDQILYPRKQFEVKIAKETKKLFEPLMEERGNEELGKIEAELRKPQKQVPVGEYDIGFDVENPEVQNWLNAYTPKFSNSLETVSTTKLRTQLIEGMKLGEGIPQLTNRINGTYDNWNKFRSESIARSEAIRASNQGALESYRQSGVVKSKVWITHIDKRTCPSCRRLDGKVIALEKNFFNKGDPAERITVGDATQTFKNDYEDISAPPRHTRCRCSIGVSFEDMRGIKPYVIDATGPRVGKVGSLKESLDKLPKLHTSIPINKYHIDTAGKMNVNCPHFKGQAAGYWRASDKSIHISSGQINNPTIFHEVGHAVYDSGLMPYEQKAVWNNWFTKASTTLEVKYPSAYSLSNKTEFFAECYSNFYQGNTNLIAPEINKWFKKYFKGHF